MDISRIKKRDLRVWLPLFEGVEVLCRHLQQRDYDALRKECSTVSFHPKTHQPVETLDEVRFRSALGRTIVEDWRGLEDDGADYPCTPENIDYLMESLTEFRLLVVGAPLSLERMIQSEKALAEKNSSTTSAPSSTTPE